jgi:HEAT repeat protein
VGCPIAVAAATKHLQDNDPNVQIAAVETLARIVRKGDKNAIASLVAQLTGSTTKDPTQPGQFVNGADPQKRSLSHMARRPGDHSFRQNPQLRIAAVRALGAVCHENDLRVAACVSEVAETDVDKGVRQAAINVLVSIGKPDLAREAKAAARQQHEFRDLNIKAKMGAIWEADQSMCEVLGMTRRQKHLAARCR